MSTDEHNPIANQVTKPSSQPTHTNDVVKMTSQNIPTSQSQIGSGIVKKGGAVMLPVLPDTHNLASEATKGGVSCVDNGGSVLTQVNVYLVYWGSVWAQNPTPRADDITESVASILSGPYMSALTQYRNIGSGTLCGTMLVTTSDPPSTFSNDDISNVLKDLINMETLTGPDEVDQILYCVI